MGLRSRLFLVSLALIAVSVLAAHFFLSQELAGSMRRRVEADLRVRLALVERVATASVLTLEDHAGWDALADDLGGRARARLTVIRRDGQVIGDSELTPGQLRRLENHAARPEVRGALASGQGQSTRFSATVRERMLYLAAPFRRAGTVAGTVRLALPLTEIDRALARMRWLLGLASLGALVLAALMSIVAVHWFFRPLRRLGAAARRMAEGDLGVRVGLPGRDEVAELGRALDRLARELSESMEDLRAERDLLGRILDSQGEGVLVLDAEGRIVRLNPALRAMLLLDAGAAGKFPLEVIRNAGLQELIEQARASSTPVTLELEIAGLKPRRLVARATLLAGEPGGVVAVFEDVTERRRLETMRRDFVANASHELRTPVASIRSAAETLAGGAGRDPAAAPCFLEIIERNAGRLENLVNDLLDLSRLESRELQLDLQPVDLGALAAQIVETLVVGATARGITLGAAIPGDLPPARANLRALDQALSNLVDNAVKYSGEGASVTIRAHVEGVNLRIAVEDTGPGIEARHLPRLFERFYRADAGRSRELGGTGLGLAIVKHLVEAMGGQVTVSSTVGQGSAFAITLPAVPPEA